MSLINDALKRAEAAQHQTPPPPAHHLPLRPVDPQVAVTHGVGLAMPVLLAAMALLLLFFVWRFYMDSGRSQRNLAAAARSETNQESLPPVEPVPAPQAAEPAPAPPAPVVSTPLPVSNSTVAVSVSTNAPVSPAATNEAATAEPAAPKLPPLKLQGVVYSKARPSAVISGKTVFLGDRIREFRVVGIGIDTVTLSGVDRTNVLVLSD